MLQSYLTRYDCLKIQQLVPSRIFCVIFYVICILDFLLLLLSFSFFIIPYQQQEYEEQYVMEQSTEQWLFGDSIRSFGSQEFVGVFVYDVQIPKRRVRFHQENQDPYLNTTGALKRMENFSAFGELTYGIIKETQICLKIEIIKGIQSRPLKNMPQCGQGLGLGFSPWLRHQEDTFNILPFEQISNQGKYIYYLIEMCIVVSHGQYIGGCLDSGLQYKLLYDNTTYQDTKIYIRDAHDPYLKGIELSKDQYHPVILGPRTYFVNKCFLAGFSLLVFTIFTYLICLVRRNK